MYPNDVMRAYSNDIQDRAQARASNARLVREIRETRRTSWATSLGRVSLGRARTVPGQDTDSVRIDSPRLVPFAERHPLWNSIVRGLGRASRPA
jgi:hypothetical protein